MSQVDKDAADSMEKGLAEAFGSEPTETPTPSVLDKLQARANSKLGVRLEEDDDDVPVEATAGATLRDPSGRYQTLGEIGRGGVGIVYKGRDHDLGRDVAMKVLKDEFADRPDVLARFVEEAQIGGQLQHPGIVPVYELGLHAGERPYFAMKLVKGETLAAMFARHSDPTTDRRRLLGIFEQVCQTIAYAHARRVVHRDLKPANVMIGAFGEVQVVDWGFAKVLQKGGVADEVESLARASERSVIETVRSQPGSGSQSVAGSMLGTPAYMPPEQALGDIERVDQRSDVFALGAILCEILTGEPPYREADGDLVRQAAAAALNGAHERLAKSAADTALITLCTECMAPARRARPESAAEVAERISEYLTSVEERARHAEVRAAEARYKHRVTLLSSAAGLVILVLGAGVWIWVQGEAQDRRARSTQQVATAMSAASTALGKAQAQDKGLDASLWNAALTSARQLESAALSDDVEKTTRREAKALLDRVRGESQHARAEIERRARDDAMLARLQTLRIPIDDSVRGEGWREKEARRLDAAYSRAFETYLGGTSLLGQPRERALASMYAGGISIALATSLDHWGLVRDSLHDTGDPPEAKDTVDLRALATLLDPGDRWRSALRVLLPNAAKEEKRLRALAEEADFASLTGAGCRVLSDALRRAGEMDAALMVLTRGQEAHPQDFDLCFRLALQFELLEDPKWESGIDTYRIANALKPAHNEVLHRQGLALEKLGRYVDAERIWRVLFSREQTNAHWLFHLGKNLDEQGKLEEAIQSLRSAIAIDPRDSRFHNNLGTLLGRQGKKNEAIKCYRVAIQHDSRNANALSNLGRALSTQRRFVEALEYLELAVAIGPRDARFHTNLGSTLSRLGETNRAIESYQLAIECSPLDADCHFNLGSALSDQGKGDEAMVRFKRALGIDPRHGRAHFGIGNQQAKQGNLTDAVESFERAIEFAPRFIHAHNALGLAFERLGMMSEALASYRDVLAMDVLYAPAHLNCGRVLQARGDLDGALAACETAAPLFAEIDSAYGRRWEEFARVRIEAIRQTTSLAEDILSGRHNASTSERWSTAIRVGYQRGRLQDVVKLTEQTLLNAPELTQGNGPGVYNAACASALLAGDAASKPSAAERARLRQLARKWLDRAVANWSTWIRDGGKRAAAGREQLRHALQDKDFASVRGDALKKLPEDERAAWQDLWHRIIEAAAR